MKLFQKLKFLILFLLLAYYGDQIIVCFSTENDFFLEINFYLHPPTILLDKSSPGPQCNKYALKNCLYKGAVLETRVTSCDITVCRSGTNGIMSQHVLRYSTSSLW